MTQEMLLAPANGWALLAAVSMGGLVGLVRQWNEGERPPAGARTFALWSTLGFVAAQLERFGLTHALYVIFAGFAALLCALVFRPADHDRPGPTTISAGFLVFVAGAMLGFDLTRYAIGLAVIVAGIIGIRGLTTTWSARLNATDVRAGLQFAFLSGVILPLVPDELLWGVINPYDTWRMVVLISGVNFAGYVAMRLLGDRAGAALTGVLGGLVSSTAVTLAFARRSRENPGGGAAYAQAVLFACAVMVPRMLALIALISPALALAYLPYAAAVALVSFATPVRLYLRKSPAQEAASPKMNNPLRAGQAVRFALLYSLIVFLVRQAQGWGGGAGLYSIGFVSGLTDVDAIALSLAKRLDAGELALAPGVLTVLLAVAANTLVKMSLGVFIGRGEFRRHIGLGLGAVLACLAVMILLRVA